MNTIFRFSVKIWLVAALLASFNLVACGKSERFKQTVTLENFEKIASTQAAANPQKSQPDIMPIELSDSIDGADYLLGPGDLLSIRVFEAAELDTEVRVSSRGMINAPLIGDLKVINLTAAEAEQLIEDMYRQNYLHDPHVAVYIKEHMSKQITLVGAVKSPGTFDYVSRKRLLDVLAMGNGLSDRAGSFAHITRRDHKSGKTINYLIDLDDLVKNGNMQNNATILGGDVIFIPASGQCFVDGAVRKPGTYPISSNMTITEAIAQAGGLASYADEESIKLIRFMGRGRERQVVSLSYSDLQAGAGDKLILKDQDIVFAESSASGKLFSGTGFSLGFMGTGVTFRNPEQ